MPVQPSGVPLDKIIEAWSPILCDTHGTELQSNDSLVVDVFMQKAQGILSEKAYLLHRATIAYGYKTDVSAQLGHQSPSLSGQYCNRPEITANLGDKPTSKKPLILPLGGSLTLTKSVSAIQVATVNNIPIYPNGSGTVIADCKGFQIYPGWWVPAVIDDGEATMTVGFQDIQISVGDKTPFKKIVSFKLPYLQLAERCYEPPSVAANDNTPSSISPSVFLTRTLTKEEMSVSLAVKQVKQVGKSKSVM